MENLVIFLMRLVEFFLQEALGNETLVLFNEPEDKSEYSEAAGRGIRAL